MIQSSLVLTAGSSPSSSWAVEWLGGALAQLARCSVRQARQSWLSLPPAAASPALALSASAASRSSSPLLLGGSGS